MTKEEILHLGTLSRIKLTDAEAEKLHTEIDSILAYVGAVSDIVAATDLTKTVGPVFNVFREDEVQNDPGAYTEDLVAAFPEREGNYLKVKKILNPDN
mgnify:FL=1